MFPKHYSLKEDKDDHFVLHDARDGKTFKVAKKGLHPANELKIMRHVQKFKSGGVAQSDELGMSNPASRMIEEEAPTEENTRPWYTKIGMEEAPADYESRMRSINPDSMPVDQRTQPVQASAPPPEVAPAQPTMEAPPIQQAPVPQAAAPIQGPQAIQDKSMAGFPTVQSLNGMQSQYEKSVKSGLAGQQEQNRQIGEMYGPKINAMEEANRHYTEAMTKYQQQAETMANDISTFKVDPERFWNEKSTGSKFGTAMSVMLGGLGAGLQGTTHNAALEVMQKSIDRDIDSQKTELGKKQTLLSDNFRAQGNLAAAEAATRAQYEAIFQGKLAQLVAKTNNPMLAAQAQQTILDSRMKMMQYLQPVAQNQMAMQLRQSLQQAAQTGGKINANPEEYIPMIVPQEHQKEAFAEVKRARDTQHGMKFGMQAFDDMVNQIKSVKTMGGLIRTEAQTRLESAILPTVQDLEGSVRQAAMDYAKKAYVPSLDDITLGRVEGKRKALEEYYKSKSAAPVFEGYAHVPLTSFAGTAPIGSQHQHEGKTATNAQGQKIIMQNGDWVPTKGKK